MIVDQQEPVEIDGRPGSMEHLGYKPPQAS